MKETCTHTHTHTHTNTASSHSKLRLFTCVRLLLVLYRLGAGECFPHSEYSRPLDRYCVLVTLWRSDVPMRVRPAVSLRESGCSVCVRVCTHVCACVYTCVCAQQSPCASQAVVCVCTRVCTHVCACVCVCKRLYLCVHVCICARAQTYVCLFTVREGRENHHTFSRNDGVW